MLNRRQVIASAAMATGVFASPRFATAAPKRVLLVHGRAQDGRNPVDIKAEWLGALEEGCRAAGVSLPAGLDIRLPFYGDVLAGFAKQLDLPLTSDIKARGDESVDEFLLFQAALAEEIRKGRGISDAEVDAEYGNNPKERGPMNWEWVQAIVRVVDKHGGGTSEKALEKFTRDVFLYVTRSAVQDAIDEIVAADLSDEPTLVIAHSLGTVVAYNVLRQKVKRDVSLFLTIGSPLGIKAIRKQLEPVARPKPVGAWFNAFDKRDIVALNPLNDTYFRVNPKIENYAEVKNKTDNRHGIIGYLDDKAVAKAIVTGLSG